MQAYFFRFSKRRESTKSPSTSDALFTLQDVIINDGNTSIMNPDIRVTYHETSSSPNTPIFLCNYVYLPRFERYYYIADWTCNADGTWTATCNVDVLASFKAQILASGGYLSRATAYNNAEVMDTFYPAMNLPFAQQHSVTTGLVGTPSDGTYMLGVVGGLSSGETTSYGAVTYYYINKTNLSQLLVDFMNTGAGDWSSVSDIGSDVIKSIVDPFKYVVSCKLYPFSPGTSWTYTNPIRLGYWESANARGARTNDFQFTTNRTIHFTTDPNDTTQHVKIVIHPNPYTYNNVTYNLPNYSPYAKYTLVHPVFGTFELDPSIIATYPDLRLKTEINFLSGYATFTVSAILPRVGQSDRWYEMIRTNFPIGIDVPLAQITTDYMSVAKSALGGIGNIANMFVGDKVGAAIGLAGNMIDAATAAISPTVQTTNPPTGGYNAEITDLWINEIRYPTITPDPAEFGNPVKRPVNSLPASGFVKMDHTDFEAGGCTSQEREMICEFLEQGVFMEGFGNG